MNSNIIFSAGIGLAWVVIVLIGVASVALAYGVGHQYVFTASGVSRIGPPIGRQLASLVFAYQGVNLPLSDLLSTEQPTLLVFLDKLAADSRVNQELVPALKALSRAGNIVSIILFCRYPCSSVISGLDDNTNVRIMSLVDDQLMVKLGVRVAPYAMLINKHRRVVSKGLVNHLVHLCLVIMKGGEDRETAHELEGLMQFCQALPSSDMVVGATTSEST